MIKILGALTIAFVSVILGKKLCVPYEKTLKIYDSLVDFVAFVKDGVERRREILPELFSEYEDENLKDFLSVLKKSPADVSSAFKAACSSLDVTEKTEKELLFFASTLGKTDYESEVAELSALLSTVKTERDALYNTLPKKIKSIKTVSLLCGVLAVIIMF